MDFKNMLQKNVGNMKSKIPSMPNIPKIPKIKSRKIFNLNRSKENVSDGNFSTSQLSIGPSSSSQPSQLHLPSTSSSIINRSPSRISTISSLVDGGQPIDYNISDSTGNKNRRRIHFDDNNDTNINEKSTSTLRFTERLTKQYKELSEFKFSHIFGKKTIVRTTEIQVDMYKQSFEEQNNELNAERRMSKDYEFEFRSIPAASINSADEPQTPTAPIDQPIISRTRSTSIGLQQQSPPNDGRITNMNEIRNDASISPPPLSRRKVFHPKDDEPEKTKKQSWKFKGFKKKSVDVNDEGDSGTQRSDKSKSIRGMWQLKRPIRIQASQDSIDDNPENSENFKKSLNNIFKKLSSFDETSDGNSNTPKKPGMWKLQRPVRVKASTEDISNDSNSGQDSEFMRQFNKITGKSSKIRNLIGKESTNENVSQQNDTEDPSKVKSIEEIEALGYGRKNLKFINMWKIRRRREIRRNEPFPINRENADEDDELKTSGMWQLRRPTRVKTVINEGDSVDNYRNPQLADITRSLMNMFKRNQNSVDETSAEGQTQDRQKRNSIWKKQKIVPATGINEEYADTYIDGSSPKIEPKSDSSAESRMWKFRHSIGTESLDTDEYVQENTYSSVSSNIKPNDIKPVFLKKKSQKKKNTLKENNEVIEENVVKKNILDKSKIHITPSINVMQEKSPESQHGPIKNHEQVPNLRCKNKLQQSIESFKSFDDSEHEAIEDLERTNKNLSWTRQNMLSNAYSTDSDEEDVITTPGFLQNQPISTKYSDIEPTIIIVSKPVPTILHYESVHQEERRYPFLPRELPPTPPPNASPPPLPNNSQLLQLPRAAVLPTPPLPKRKISTPFIAHQDIITLTPPQSQLSSSKPSSPPSLPTTLPPELSPPKSLPPPLPTSPRPQLYDLPSLSPVLQPTRLHTDNKSRPKHSRKPSMDSNDSESWISDNLRNRNVLELNQIDETYEQWNSVNKSNIKNNALKKWESVDIFNGNDEIFDDFDDELKNEPVIAIVENISKQQRQPVLSQVKKSPVLSQSTGVLVSDVSQPAGVPVTLVKHKISRPLVKQGSLRRQFSEEKDAEDLNKKGSVNKMISRFDPERYSSRRSIKHERISTAIPLKDNEEKLNPTKAFVEELHPIPKIINRSSSLEVEIDKNDLQLMDGSTTEDDSDNSDSGDKNIPARPPTVLERKQPTVNIIIQKNPDKIPVKLVEKKLAPPPPPPTIKITTQSPNISNNNQNNNNRQQTNDKPVIKDPTTVNCVKDSNENNRTTTNTKKHILQSRQNSEDNFYSLDYTDQDETVKGYPLDGISLVKEEYSIDL